MRQVLPPLVGTFGRHHDVVGAGATGPDVEVLPFQEGIDRPPNVEGESVRFGPEKQHDLRFWHNLADRLGK